MSRRFIPFEKAKTDPDSLLGACCCACPAADAFGRLRILDGIDVHLADPGAFAAAHTLIVINGQLVEADFVEQAVDCAEQAKRLAEETIYDDTANEDYDQQKQLPAKEKTDGLLKLGMRTQQRNAAKQRAGRTDILAESRLAHADNVGDGDRHDDHKDEKNGIFGVFEYAGKTALFSGQRDMCQQLLNQPERTEKAAHKAPQQHADGQQKACDIEAEIKLHGAADGLQRADRAGNGGGRAGIAVQPRIAELFPRSGIDSCALFAGEIADMRIGQTERGDLDHFAPDGLRNLHIA